MCNLAKPYLSPKPASYKKAYDLPQSDTRPTSKAVGNQMRPLSLPKNSQ